MSADAQLAAFLQMHNCEHAYLDVGTNIGVQIRKLYQPHLYPGAEIEPLFSVLYGEAPRCNVCAVGLEPRTHCISKGVCTLPNTPRTTERKSA